MLVLTCTRIVRVRLLRKECPMDKKFNKKLGNHWVKPTRLPGVFEKKGGGYIVRARVKDPMSGKLREIKKVFDEASEREAFDWLENEKSRIRQAIGSEPIRKQRFGDYAVSLLERKLQMKEIRSATGRDRWRHTLTHLIAGTESRDETILVPAFGEMAIDEIRTAHVDRWREGIATLIARGDYSPNTANGWLSILRVVFKAAVRDFELTRNPVDHVRDFDTSDHITYSEEAPQSLTPEQVSEFLAWLRELYPQHYAITYLGICTGLRPSSMRPLRRMGDQPDILWEEGRLLVRRSQTRGQEVLQTTKQRTRYSILLPSRVITVLRWHVEEQLTPPAQQESELLFPSVNGGFRAPTVLNKPFAEVSDAMELGYHFTQKGMRRTFNDLARAAEVQDIVTRSISGHATERMQHHYSTVRGHEQHEGLSKVVDLMTARVRRASSEGFSPTGGACGGASSSQVVPK